MYQKYNIVYIRHLFNEYKKIKITYKYGKMKHLSPK